MFFHFCKDSIEYTKENEETIADINCKSVKMGSAVYLFLLVVYFLCAHTFFPEYNTDLFYFSAIMIQIVVELFLLSDVVHLLSAKWKNRVCMLFQLYVIGVITYISIFPREIEQPAVYFAPMVLTFAAVLIFPWTTTVGLALIEVFVFVFITGLVKTPEIHMLNAFASLMTMAVVSICSYVLCKLRINDNNSKYQLEELCAVDKLTGLNNKSTCELLCKSYLLENPIGNCTLMMIDFDNFKNVNDSFGHKQGDAVLQEFGKILKRAARESDVVGRVGGDEFLLLYKGCSDYNLIRERAMYIIRSTHEIMSDILSYEFTCSIGIAVQDGEEYTYEKLVSKADVALYEAKKNGKNRMHFFQKPQTEKKQNQKEKPLILVVDDLEVSRAVLRSCLGSRYEILEAENGQEALQYLEELHDKIAIVLLDLEMPVMNGYEVIHHMKKTTDYASIPIIVITINERSEYQVKELGVEDVITKPFDPFIVRTRVEQVILDKSTLTNK